MTMWVELFDKDTFTVNITRLSEYHHSEKNDMFDKLAAELLASHRALTCVDYARLRTVYELMTQNSIARRNLSKAMKECECAKNYALKSGVPSSKLGRIHLLFAEIVHRQGALPGKVLIPLGLAVMAFSAEGNQDGVAESLRELAYQNARCGRFRLAHSQISKAIEKYRNVGNFGAVVVTKGTLAGIYQMQGNIIRTRQLYEECLNYWSLAGHKRWTTYYQGKLRSLKNGRC